jgi:hypothetical protein
MHIPFKVATTTSNFMIEVTAAASAGVHLHRGYIDPGLAMPVMLGVLLGSLLGVRSLVRSNTMLLRFIFDVFFVFLALEMIYNDLLEGSEHASLKKLMYAYTKFFTGPFTQTFLHPAIVGERVMNCREQVMKCLSQVMSCMS